MKAISLLQPWASLIVMGAKQFETRSWGTKYRGLLLIHASLKKDDAKRLCEVPGTEPFINFIRHWTDLPYGAIIGKVYLTSVDYTQRVIGSISDQEKAFGDYSHGRYAWELKDAVKFDKPIPYKGALSIWEFPDGLLPIENK